MNFSLPIWSCIIHFGSIGLLDPKNMGVAAGISFLSPQKLRSRPLALGFFVGKFMRNDNF